MDFRKIAMLFIPLAAISSCKTTEDIENADNYYRKLAREEAEYPFNCQKIKTKVLKRRDIQRGFIHAQDPVIAKIGVSGCGKRAIYKVESPKGRIDYIYTYVDKEMELKLVSDGR